MNKVFYKSRCYSKRTYLLRKFKINEMHFSRLDSDVSEFSAKQPPLQFPADLVTFTEEILNGKLHFLCSTFCRTSWWLFLNLCMGVITLHSWFGDSKKQILFHNFFWISTTFESSATTLALCKRRFLSSSSVVAI